MRSIRKRTGALAAALALCAAMVAAGVAFGTVTVYQQSFNGKASVRAMKQVSGGKRCSKGHREKARAMRVVLHRRDVLCSYSPPVIADSAVPDHEISVTARILKKQTPRALRKPSYVALRLRLAKGSRYELQVFPHSGRYRLLRTPSGGGSEFPAVGQSDAIKGIGGKNLLRLRAFGAKIAAFVNNERVAVATDTEPGQVKGRKMSFGLGSQRDRKSVV